MRNMRKVLLINGSPHQAGCTNRALEECASSLRASGIEASILWLGNKPVPDCIACGKCSATGKCIFDDAVNQVLEMLDDIDGLVVGSPVYYAGPTGAVCSFMDRLFYIAEPRMAGKAAAAVVSCRRGGSSSAFDRINKYFSICSMNIVGSQYWNQVHGRKPEDLDRDQEGLQTMRTLGANMASLIKAQEGVSLPLHEKRIRTNFGG
jgi:multimeric flavodoxin WrbA